MAVIVSLRDVVGEMLILSDESHAYVHKVTGEVISVTNNDLANVENDADWRKEAESKLEQEYFGKVEKVFFSDEYLELPDKFEIHEYDIMKRFCLSIPNEEISNELLDKISTSGVFRRFKNTISRYEIENDWYKFRDEVYKGIAISWLKINGFAYTDDMNR